MSFCALAFGIRFLQKSFGVEERRRAHEQWLERKKRRVLASRFLLWVLDSLFLDTTNKKEEKAFFFMDFVR